MKVLREIRIQSIQYARIYIADRTKEFQRGEVVIINKYFLEILAVSRRILTELLHMRSSLFFWTLFPFLMLLLFGFIDEGTSRSFEESAPGILIGAALFFSCLGGPIATIFAERKQLTLKRLLISPLSGISYFLGIFMAYLVIALGQTLVVYGVAFFFGGTFHGSILLGFSIIFLSVASYVGLGFFFGSKFARTAEDVNGPVAAIGVPLLVLGGTFFPPSELPPYLLKIAYLDPIFHMNEAFKGVSANNLGWSEIYDHIIFLIIFTILSLLMGIYSYNRMLNEEKRL